MTTTTTTTAAFVCTATAHMIMFYILPTVRHPPGLCFGVPGLSTFARVCVELYDINFSTKHICARLTGVIDLKVMYSGNNNKKKKKKNYYNNNDNTCTIINKTSII